MKNDIRWKQRFNNFILAYREFDEAVELANSKELSKLENQGLIEDGEIWMDMIKSRNLTSHTYDKELANEIILKIVENYHPQLQKFSKLFTARYDEN
jgi:nucleotidyltransferase substrate binding protein (TIGR01987 family)